MHSIHFLIEKFKKVDWGKTVATLGLTILDEHQKPIVTLHDCKLVDWDKGFFVSAPSKKVDKPYKDKNGKMKEYIDTAFIHSDYRDELSNLVAGMYDPTATTTGKTTEKAVATEEELPF